MAAEPRPRRWFPTLLVAAFAAAVDIGLWRAASPPAGPVDVPFDRVACARCHMLVSDPRFAAQLHEPVGTVRFFDDPGCALLYDGRGAHADDALYFHDSRGPGWLHETEVAFVRVPETPMDYGFAAVPRGSAPDALAPAAVLAELDARTAAGAPR